MVLGQPDEAQQHPEHGDDRDPAQHTPDRGGRVRVELQQGENRQRNDRRQEESHRCSQSNDELVIPRRLRPAHNRECRTSEHRGHGERQQPDDRNGEDHPDPLPSREVQRPGLQEDRGQPTLRPGARDRGVRGVERRDRLWCDEPTRLTALGRAREHERMTDRATSAVHDADAIVQRGFLVADVAVARRGDAVEVDDHAPANDVVDATCELGTAWRVARVEGEILRRAGVVATVGELEELTNGCPG